jgi:hypothetical protein
METVLAMYEPGIPHTDKRADRNAPIWKRVMKIIMRPMEL